jgi:DNA polymerase-3 subunit epsilon
VRLPRLRRAGLRRSGLPRSQRAVPGWAALDLPWRQAEFVVVDLETTGLHLRRDDIVSYGAVLIRQGRMLAGSQLYGLVRPRHELSRTSITVHGLREADLADAPPLAECVRQLTDLLDGRVLVAHAAWVEQAFLNRAFADSGVRLDGPIVDTAALAREAQVALAGTEGEPSLERLARGLRLPVHTPHHALGDALTTAQVFLALVSRLDREEPQTVKDLQSISRRQSRL